MQKTYKTTLFSALFIALVMVSNFRFSSMYLYYSIDRDGFIETLCENTDRPELECDGKCMLSQMLLDQDNDKETPMPIIGWENELFFMNETFSSFVFDFEKSQETYFHYSNTYTYRFCGIPNKPPIV